MPGPKRKRGSEAAACLGSDASVDTQLVRDTTILHGSPQEGGQVHVSTHGSSAIALSVQATAKDSGLLTGTHAGDIAYYLNNACATHFIIGTADTVGKSPDPLDRVDLPAEWASYDVEIASTLEVKALA